MDQELRIEINLTRIFDVTAAEIFNLGRSLHESWINSKINEPIYPDRH